MTTRKHTHDASDPHPRPSRHVDPAGAGAEPLNTPVEARLEARIAAQREQKVDELEAAIAEATDRYLRLAADFENYKKRTRQ